MHALRAFAERVPLSIDRPNMTATSAYLNRPLRTYLAARRDRARADRRHYRIQARNAADAIRSGRSDLAAMNSHWADCPDGVKAIRRENIETWLRFVRELRALHTASIRCARAGE